jgi:hypothetical protein
MQLFQLLKNHSIISQNALCKMAIVLTCELGTEITRTETKGQKLLLNISADKFADFLFTK